MVRDLKEELRGVREELRALRLETSASRGLGARDAPIEAYAGVASPRRLASSMREMVRDVRDLSESTENTYDHLLSDVGRRILAADRTAAQLC